MEQLQTQSNGIVATIFQFAILITFKFIGYYAANIIMDPRNKKLVAICMWCICQCIISWINNLFGMMSFAYFILLNILCCTVMVYLQRIRTSLNFFIFVILSELFWLYFCNDISCIAAYILLFEGCFIQRIIEEYLTIKFTDGHILCFAICKIIFISWIYISLNWIISVFELLYFIVPITSLKFNKWKLKPDQWFFVDGSMHISLFLFWWFSSQNLFYSNY